MPLIHRLLPAHLPGSAAFCSQDQAQLSGTMTNTRAPPAAAASRAAPLCHPPPGCVPRWIDGQTDGLPGQLPSSHRVWTLCKPEGSCQGLQQMKRKAARWKRDKRYLHVLRALFYCSTAAHTDCVFIIKEEAKRVGNITNGMERSGRDFPRNSTTQLVPEAPPCTTAAPKGPWKQLARSSYLESEQDTQALQPPRPESCHPSSHGQAFGQTYICTLRQIFLSSMYHQVCFKMLLLLSH
ncbi:hypothetical protein Anapl_18116 [Anas platyrhynchos]|uniref:Uncharacterized protein n=1 Tax=Anas platyrhynchos TaxID=8839 RepID=R0JBM6_ANAPL|nr:hypothetical protein Anapl_18116 [Anas platyrhynchos]